MIITTNHNQHLTLEQANLTNVCTFSFWRRDTAQVENDRKIEEKEPNIRFLNNNC